LSDKEVERHLLAPFRPRYYGTENSEAATGLTYRLVKDEAIRLGVRILKLGKGERRFAIDADDFDAKVRAENERTAAAPEQPENPEDAVLRSLGLERIK
jgi:hypothetical protein